MADNNIDEFIKDWEIDKEHSSATHSSGVGFKVLQNGENSPSRLEILNMPEWFQKEMSTGKSFQECRNKLAKFRNQFVMIHQEVMTSPQKPVVSINRGGDYGR